MPRVVVTLPAYRAAGTLAQTLADLPAGVADEIILVDDASPDETVKRARELGLRVFVHPQNRGYGGNQKTCYSEALRLGADIVVMLHPDYQYDPRAVPLLVAPIIAGDADMTFGSRFAGLGDPRAGGMPTYRYVGNRLTTVVENLMLGSRFTELHSGMRAYTRRCLLSLPFRSFSDDFVFDTQFLVDAVTGGQRVVEVPIPTRYTKESSSISVKRSLIYIGTSMSYTAARTAARGRRGKRWPVTRRGLRRGRLLPAVASIERECVLCGGRDQAVVYPANAAGPWTGGMLACTTDRLGEHDDIVQCRRCGLLRSIPTASPETIRDLYGSVVDEPYLNSEETRRAMFRWILREAAGFYAHGARLLEIGSHVGLLLDEARAAGWDARGVEPSKWAVEVGRERFGANLRRGTVEELDEPDRSCDAAVMIDVLDHVTDPLDALRRIRHTIAEDGILVLATLNAAGAHARARGGSWPWLQRSHLTYFTPETLNATLQRSGFRPVSWSSVPRSFRLSQLTERARPTLSHLAPVADAASRIADPRVKLGWLGDTMLTIARVDDQRRG